MLTLSNNNGLNNSKTVGPIVWSIAGSDSVGDAGIQADSLTIQDLGGHAKVVINYNNSIQAAHSLVEEYP